MSCTYIFNDNPDVTPKTYHELVDMILSKILSGEIKIDDIVYSRSTGEQLQIHNVEKLKELNNIDLSVKENTSFLDGEPIISTNDTISSQELVDSIEFKLRTGANVAQINEDNFIRERASVLVQNGHSEEEAIEMAKAVVEHWHLIQSDAKDLHMIISKFNFGRSQTDFEEATEDTAFKDVSDELYESMNRILHDIYKASKSNDLKSITLNNINIKVALEGIDKDLLLHIDKAIVDGDGIIHIYSFKTTTIPYYRWDEEKKKKYKTQLALIKRGLESLGFDPKKIDLNIVPIEIQYNEDLSKITSAKVFNPLLFNIYHKTNGGIVDALAEQYNWAKKIIKSTASFNNVTLEDKQPVEDLLNFLFLNKNLRTEGVLLTAESWIKRNIKDGGKIRRLQDPDYDFIIYFDKNDVVKIPKGDDTNPLKNSKLIEEVKKRTSILDKNEGGLMEKIVLAILKSYDAGYPNFLGYSAPFLRKVLGKYVYASTKTENGEKKKVHDWEFYENDILTSANILAFRKTDGSGLIDFVVLSPYDLKNKTKLKKSNQHILGDHLYTGSVDGSLLDYKPTYGNLETTRAALIINQILPKITGEWKLGKLHIISLENGGQGNIHDLENLNKNLVTPLIKFMNENPNMHVENNFVGLKFINPFDVLMEEYKNLMDYTHFAEEDGRVVQTSFEQLEQAPSIEMKRTLLMDLATRLQKIFPELSNVKELYTISKGNTNSAYAAKLYINILKSLRYYEVPEVSSIQEKLSSIPAYVSIAERVPNKNFQVILHVYTKAIDNVANSVLNEIQVTRNYFLKYYDDCGYSRLKNDVFGGQELTFRHLYKLDDEGNKTLTLKNPYNMSEDLEDYEREFLKKVLFSFNKIRSLMYGNEFNFTVNDVNSEAFKLYTEQTDGYFDIPLERASQSTRMQKPIKERMSYTFRKIKDSIVQRKNMFDVFGLDLSDEEIADREESISTWQLRNKFERGEVNRVDVIANHDANYFETNLDKLLVDFIEKFYEHKELNKALMISKAVIFELEMLRGLTNDEDVINQTEDLIDKFNKVNIFNASIMETHSQQFLGAIQPLRKIVSTTLIAGNIISAFRDSFEGVWQNTTRALNHFLTNINLSQVMLGYKTVIENSFTDPRSINIVNLLCLKYRLSNIDISRISEGAKTEGGIVNYNDWLYATIRKPDFLNRMVLFVAQCYKDGVYEAFSINDKGALEYDWKKDKRFSIYASGDKSNPEYAKQMGAYYNAVRAYNNDHPDATISFNGNEDPLPEPYSDAEIKQFKLLSNSIYGAYDKSTKALYEYMAVGTVFGMFSTWMNGMYTNYFAKPGQYYSSEFRLEQETDASGNLLFFDDEGNLIYKRGDKYYYDGTDTEVKQKLTNIQPVMKKVPVIVLGVFYSLCDAFKAIKNHEYKEWKALSPQDRDNLAKLLTDILCSLFFSGIFGLVINPAYKDYKKDMKNHPFVENCAIELLWKSSSRSFDGFRGPVNLIEYVGENMNTPLYSLPIKLVKETVGAAFGEKTMFDVATRNIAVFRVFLDSYKAEKKK